MQIRFDDRRPGHRRSFEFVDPIEVLATDSPSAVPAVVVAAEEHAAAGHWVAGFLAYEAAPGLDPVLVTHPPAAGIPVAWFAVFAGRRLDPRWPDPLPARLDGWEPDQDRAAYRAALEKIHGYIGAGDTYQVNYTMRMRGRLAGDPLSAYAGLVSAQSSGFAAYLDLGDMQVLSASPELFFSWDADGITVRPMKGTIGRGRWSAEDHARRLQLLSSEKDRAENLMIVDLLRNDLGRFAEYGTVEVTDLFAVEKFETLWQLTSTIRAQPGDGATLLDLLRALFPSGSVTGAPKARTMEIIRRLEPTPRGLYCGAIGLLAPPGSGEPRAQFNVAIRTVVVDSAGNAEYGTGGGITWDSRAAGEYDEALVKAAVLTHRRAGFSLLETMRWTPQTGVVRRRRHLDRMRASADYFGFPFPDAAIAVRLDAITGAADCRVRVLVDPAGQVTVETAPLVVAGDRVRLAIDTVPVDAGDALLFHKTTHRAVYEEAAARHPQADDVVLVNRAGCATETTRANLAVRLGAAWLTPPLDDGCLPGVYRAVLLEEGTLQEASIPADRLADADELAVISSLHGWLPATSA